MKTKNMSEHTDRELLEKTVLYTKITADNSTFIKVYLIIVTILGVLGVFSLT